MGLFRVLHKRQLLFPTVVVLVVAGVLVQGALERDPPTVLTGELVAEESVQPVAPRTVIRADLEKTPLTYQSDYWNQLAEGARANLILVGPSRTAAVLIGPRLALTTADVARELVAERRRAALTRDVPDVNPEVGPPVPGTAGVSDVPKGSEASPEESGAPRLRAWDEDIGLALFEGMSRALLKLSSGSVHDYATISDDSPSPRRASRARRAATSAGIS